MSVAFPHGIYNIFKPFGVTSHDVIDQLRTLSSEKRVGHAGTLDPLASGVLVVAIGREYTKKLNELMIQEKEYIAEITLGQASTTDDAEGEKRAVEVQEIPDREEIQRVIANWIGTVQQAPPVYSAIKVKGTPAHRRVRSGQHVELLPREVEIKNIEILTYAWPILKIQVTCGKGVYIRSLARDIGNDLKVGGYLSSLVRTRVGDFTIDSALHVSS